MADASDLSLDAQIALVEKRMELRRDRIALNLQDARAQASTLAHKAMRWLPAVGAAGALAVGFLVARQRRAAKVAPSVVARAFARTPPPVSAPAARGALATALMLAAGALRFAMSSEGRLAWRAFQTARTFAQTHRFGRRS